jgi:hypothetical protein
MRLDHLPASVAFCDVETTGLGHHDRIVSFGGIGMISRDLAKGCPAYLYLVFKTTATPNGFMASRIRLCACRTRSQFMLPRYGASCHHMSFWFPTTRLSSSG